MFSSVFSLSFSKWLIRGYIMTCFIDNICRLLFQDSLINGTLLQFILPRFVFVLFTDDLDYFCQEEIVDDD